MSDVDDEKEKLPLGDEHAVTDLQGDDGAELARVISGGSRIESESEDDVKEATEPPVLKYDKAPW